MTIFQNTFVTIATKGRCVVWENIQIGVCIFIVSRKPQQNEWIESLQLENEIKSTVSNRTEMLPERKARNGKSFLKCTSRLPRFELIFKVFSSYFW